MGYASVAVELQPERDLYTTESLRARPFAGYALAIDPPGTIEADDAISVRLKPNSGGNEADVTVCISDGALLSPHPDLYGLAVRRLHSRYPSNGRAKYMLPRWAIEQLSLSRDVPGGAPCLAVDFDVSYEGISLRSVRFARSFVEPTTYGEFAQRVRDRDPRARTIARVGKILHGHDANIRTKYGEESAKNAVSAYMIAANRLLSAYTAQRESSVLHRHCGNLPDAPIEQQRAVYDITPLPHEALLIDRYGHWTSPIRRFPDLYNHMMLAGADGAEEVDLQRVVGRLNRTAYRLGSCQTEQRAA